MEVNIDRFQKYIVATFENGYVSAYKMVVSPHKSRRIAECKAFEHVHRFGPFGSKQQIYIDGYATYMAVLGENLKQIIYYTFDWEY